MQKHTLPDKAAIFKYFSEYTFKRDALFHWSPLQNTIYYHEGSLSSMHGFAQLFHEIGHARARHTNFQSGISLLKMEAEAWNIASELARIFSVTIQADHIERCLDSYRDWLHQRSTCPHCKTIAVESSENHYSCFNCFQEWKVSTNQITRNYRLRLELRS